MKTLKESTAAIHINIEKSGAFTSVQLIPGRCLATIQNLNI